MLHITFQQNKYCKLLIIFYYKFTKESTPSVRTMKKYIAHSTKNNNIFFVTIYVKLTSVGVMAAVATSPLSIINIQS